MKWLCVGSIPAAFSGVIIAGSLGGGEQVQNVIRIALGIALLLAAAGLIVRDYIGLVEHARRRDGRADPLPQGRPRLQLRPLPTVVVGIVGGVVVGVTSVGSGSLIIIALMTLYPRLKASELVTPTWCRRFRSSPPPPWGTFFSVTSNSYHHVAADRVLSGRLARRPSVGARSGRRRAPGARIRAPGVSASSSSISPTRTPR